MAEAEEEFRQGMWATDDAAAEAHFKRSIELHPTPAAYNNLGLLYLREGQTERAKQMWQRALELDPTYEPARRNLDRAR
jgi:lipoprotein NlpI